MPTRASREPAPNTVWVASRYSGHAVHPAASSRRLSRSADVRVMPYWVPGRAGATPRTDFTPDSRFNDLAARYLEGHKQIEEVPMLALVLVLLLVLALGGAGFAANWLWIIAGILLVVWVLGFAFRGPATGARWYRW